MPSECAARHDTVTASPGSTGTSSLLLIHDPYAVGSSSSITRIGFPESGRTATRLISPRDPDRPHPPGVASGCTSSPRPTKGRACRRSSRPSAAIDSTTSSIAIMPTGSSPPLDRKFTIALAASGGATLEREEAVRGEASGRPRQPSEVPSILASELPTVLPSASRKFRMRRPSARASRQSASIPSRRYRSLVPRSSGSVSSFFLPAGLFCTAGAPTSPSKKNTIRFALDGTRIGVASAACAASTGISRPSTTTFVIRTSAAAVAAIAHHALAATSTLNGFGAVRKGPFS